MGTEEFRQNFDFNDPKNNGRPIFFDPDLYLDAVEQMISADEIVFALKMLDNMPGWYRDHGWPRAQEIRHKVFRQLMLISDYANDSSEVELDLEKLKGRILTMFCHPRAEIVTTMVRQLNEQGIEPTIIELGPFDYWLPVGLSETAKVRFEYLPISLNSGPIKHIKANFPAIRFVDKPGEFNLFCCLEVIEHMMDPTEIRHPLDKLGCEPQIVVVSTPLYTMGGGLPDWDSRELGHVRTYTPNELMAFCQGLFGGRKWSSMSNTFGQVCVGAK